MFKPTNMTDQVTDVPPVEQEERQMTPEEIVEYREQMEKFYEEQLPLLRLQKEYEVLLADIEEARTRRIHMMATQAQFREPRAKDENLKDPGADKFKRALKKEA